jgi:hypothetical protein
MSIIVDKINNTRELITNTPYTDTEASLRRASIPMSKVLSGLLSLSNTVKTLGFDGITYTGNGTTQDIVTGIASVDFTVASNGSGYWLDRSVNQVKNDAGVVQASGDCVVNTSKVHFKERTSTGNNMVYDSIRGVGKEIYTNLTNGEGNNIDTLTVFSVAGFSVGADTNANQSTIDYIAYQTLYTHIAWGVTSQGKFQIEAYNPVTNEGMVYYIGSGVAGHQISHSMGKPLDIIEVKLLTTYARNWDVYTSSMGATKYLSTNLTSAEITSSFRWSDTEPTDEYFTVGTSDTTNFKVDEEYIAYYKCKSETFTTGTYTGTGSAGNFVETKDINGVARKPRRFIIKRTDNAGDWVVFDTEREGYRIELNTSDIEAVSIQWSFGINGMTSTGSGYNESGYSFLYLVEFDTDNTGTTGSYFDMATDTTNLQIADGLVSISSGYDSQGAINKVISKSGTMIPTGGYV